MSINIAFEVLTRLHNFLKRHFDNLKRRRVTHSELEAKKVEAKQIIVDTYNQLVFILLKKGYHNPVRIQQLATRKTQLLLVMYAKARQVNTIADDSEAVTST